VSLARLAAEGLALALALAPLAACSPPAADAAAPVRWEARSLADGSALRFEAGEQAILVNVWASWCEPCRREMPSLEAAHRALAPRGIRVVGINVDRDALLARELARKLDLTFDNVSDPEQAVAMGALKVARLPTTLAIGRDGRVRWREESARDWAEPARLAWIERSLAPAEP
jgi:thiol-disulfide isomerase/thioredoxin